MQTTKKRPRNTQPTSGVSLASGTPDQPTGQRRREQFWVLTDRVLSGVGYDKETIQRLLLIFALLGSEELADQGQFLAQQIADWLFQHTEDFEQRRDAYLKELLSKA